MLQRTDVRTKSSLCQGICQRFRLKGFFFSAQCQGQCPVVWVVSKDGLCYCCTGHVRMKKLSHMDATALTQFYSVINDNSVLKILERLTQATTTKKLMLMLNSFTYHKVLRKLELIGMIERRQIKIHNRTAILNELTLKGRRFLVFSQCYTLSTNNNGNGRYVSKLSTINHNGKTTTTRSISRSRWQ